MDGQKFPIKAVVAPVPVLCGSDLPLEELILRRMSKEKFAEYFKLREEEVFAVMTRTQSRKEHKAEEQQTQKKEVAQRTANPLESEMTVQTARDDSEENEETKEANSGFDFIEDLFG